MLPRGVSATALAIVMAACVFTAALAAASALSRRDADSFQRKLLQIEQYSLGTLPGARLTPISESELNSYIRLDLAELLPAGVEQPWVDIIGEGRVGGEAIVDLDAVRNARRTRSLLDPMNLLSGRLRVTAEGGLRTDDGKAWFDLESATVAGVPVPKLLLQEVIAYYTRSDEFPKGIALDEPLPLPAGIKEIHVRQDQAVVVQR